MEKENVTLDPFFQVLKTKFPELTNLISNKGYILIAPAKSVITESELTLKFYYNHIYKVSKYDPTLYINLNGKILKSEEDHFETFLNWTKPLKLEIKELNQMSLGTNVYIQYYQLSNAACDESIQSNFVSSKDTNKDDEVLSCKSMNDYLKFFDENKNSEKIKIVLNELIHSLKNNFIFMKDYESSYIMNFKENVNKFIDCYIIGTQKNEENIKPFLSKKNSDNVIYQFVESLVFSNLYDFIKKNLNEFFKEKNEEFKNNIKENIYKYELSGLNVNEICKNCKFEKAIEKINEIEKLKTVFEKTRLLSEVNSLITEEVKYEYESAKKIFSPNSDLLLQFWIYVISHCNIQNIFAEEFFLTSFSLYKGYGPDAYIYTTFSTAFSVIKEETVKNTNKVISAQKIEAQHIVLGDG